MDIMNPTAPALPHKEATYGQAAIDDAEKTLSDFKALSKEMTAQGTALHKAAKDLLGEVKFNIEEGMKKVEKAEWSGADYTSSRANLRGKQFSAWDNLQKNADAVRAKLEGPYKRVLASKENILRARGDGITGGVLGSLTKDQKQVRKVYDNKLKHGFEDAIAAHDGLVSYPDGLLTQIPLLNKRALEALEAAGK